LQWGVGEAQSLSEAHSHRFVVALQTFPPLAAVQLFVQEPPSAAHVIVHGPSHRPRSRSQVVVNFAHTLTISLAPCFLIENVLAFPMQLKVPIFALSNAQRPNPPTSTQ
jgi:hypothetical protein